MPNYSFNSGYSGGGTAVSQMGEGSGGIQQYGYANPYGPYSLLPATQAGAGGAGGFQGRPGWTDLGNGVWRTAEGTTVSMGKPDGGNTSTSTTASSAPGGTATSFFNDVLSGNQMPYDAASQGSLYSTASDMSAQAEAANNQRATASAQRGGASGNDPSLQGALLSNQATRQGQNAQSMQDITSKANSANFGAKMDAANSLRRYDLQQQSINSGNMHSLMPFSGMGGGGGGYSQKPQSTPGNYFTGYSTSHSGSQANPWVANTTNNWMDSHIQDSNGDWHRPGSSYNDPVFGNQQDVSPEGEG